MGHRAARRAITSLSGRYFSEKCGWARTSQTLARAHPHQRNLRACGSSWSCASRRGGFAGCAQAASPSSGSSPATAPAATCQRGFAKCITPAADGRCFAITRMATLLRGCRRARRLPGRRGRSRQPVCRRCILPRGIMCIFMRRAASILIQTCGVYRFLYEKRRSPESVLQKLQLSGSDAPPEGSLFRLI